MIEKLAENKKWPLLPPIKTGIRGRCPRCGQGKLFDGFLTIREGCAVCGLDYSFADPADGPAFFVICFGCVPAVTVALSIEIAFSPPYWVHLLTSLPFLLLTCIPPLRPLKGWLVATQFFSKAGEVRFVTTNKEDRKIPRPETVDTPAPTRSSEARIRKHGELP
jgi:uncharacterized protein (DUF983 family)